MNVLKTGFLLSMLTLLLVGVGHLLGGQQGAMIAFAFAMVMNLVSYWFSDKMVLAMYRAKPLIESDAPQVYRAVQDIALRNKMPMPKLYWIPTATPNAFATGRNPNHAAVAVTSGLLEMLNEEEIKGVLAHELSHVRNRDTLVMSVAAAVAGAISMVAHWARWGMMFGGRGDRDDRREGGAVIQLVSMIMIAVLAPLAAMLIQMAISRTREYSADETGARLIGNPYALASALEKMERAAHEHPLPVPNPATAHLFIVNPLSGEGLSRLFSTHPPTEERIRRLRAMRLA